MVLSIPFTTLIIKDQYEELTVRFVPEGYPPVYIIDFNYEVIEGGSDVYVSSITRHNSDLHVVFLNRTNAEVKINVFIIQGRELLARQHNCTNPIYVGTTKKVKIGRGPSETITIKSDITYDNIYMLGYTMKVISGTQQTRVNGFLLDSFDNALKLTLYNDGGGESEVEVGILMINPEVERTSRNIPNVPEPCLIQGEYVTAQFDGNNVVSEVTLTPKQNYGAIVSFTFKPQFDSPNDIYLSERYYEGSSLKLKFINRSGAQGTIDVCAWETAPYQY